YEQGMTFVEYISYQSLARSEGLVLRYLADAYRALRQTVPEDAKTEEVHDVVEWLGEMVRQVDSSLLDEWEQLLSPIDTPERMPVAALPPAVTRNQRAFRVLVRNALFRRVELAALSRYQDLTAMDPDIDWRDSLEEYYAEHDVIGTGPEARGPAMFMVTVERDRWLVRQILADPAEDHDWGISAEVDLRRRMRPATRFYELRQWIDFSQMKRVTAS
ncbi:MAG: DUF3516 domain-containing protein, partial [Longispora sp.]|nr:DUF3516 domain-containing protein [Longispora sp. (in: high G+C Gram-positive bacteria)]